MGGTKIPRATKNTNKKSTSFHSFIQDDEHSKLKHQWQVAAAGQKLVVDLASGLNEIAARRHGFANLFFWNCLLQPSSPPFT